jgi:hypothetical protein
VSAPVFSMPYDTAFEQIFATHRYRWRLAGWLARSSRDQGGQAMKWLIAVIVLGVLAVGAFKVHQDDKAAVNQLDKVQKEIN